MKDTGAVSFGFKRNESLKSKKNIAELFRKGKRIKSFPLQLLYLPHPGNENNGLNQIMFIVSKRKLRKAVQRNHAKRLMREAYRTQKDILTHAKREMGKTDSYIMACIYLAATEPDYPDVHLAMGHMLHQLAKLKATHNKGTI